MGETPEDQSIAESLDLLFDLTDLLDDQSEQHGWSALTDDVLERIWDNAEDAVYDNWKALYNLLDR